MKKKLLRYTLVLFFLTLFGPLAGGTEEKQATSLPSNSEKPTLARAVMCAGLREGTPCNPGAVFPVHQREVSCFSAFDVVPRKTTIYHSWFHRDVLITRQKLILNPPRWSTYSSIQLRESDKGPWRVEVADQDARLIEVLRFSITD